MEELSTTQTEEELPLDESTSNESVEDSVETFDDQLDNANSEEELVALAEGLRNDTPEEEVEEELIEDTAETVEEDEVDETEQPNIDFDFNIGSGIKIKDGDVELNITDKAKAIQLMNMGLNYGGKTTELAKHRAFVNYAEENNISLDDIQMLKDIRGGNKDAYSALAKQSGIDVYDVNEAHTYNPEPAVLPQQVDPMVDMVADQILANEDHTTQFKKWINHMPPEVKHSVQTNAAAIQAVKADMDAGIFDKAMEQAYSDVRVNGAEFNSAYLKAKETLLATKVEEPKAKTITRGERVRASASRGKASSNKTYGSIQDMNDDDFLDNLESIVSGLQRP